MSFTYNGTPGENTLEAVRFEVQDINPAAPLLQDAEITYALTIEGVNSPENSSLGFQQFVAVGSPQLFIEKILLDRQI